MFLRSVLILFTIHQIHAQINGPQARNSDAGQNTEPTSLDERIVGGSAVDVTDFPFQISLYSNNVFICGGSIISREWVLTAAHCLESRKKYTVRAGSSYINSGGTTHSVISHKSHERYVHRSSKIDNDIAVMKVSPPFHFDDSCWPIDLLTPSDTIGYKERSVVSGFGYTREGGRASNKLLAVKLPILSLRDCASAYKRFDVSNNFLCAGYDESVNKGSCQGDSGGPLTIYRNGEPKLAGIVSWGSGCKLAGFYTSVKNYYDWITKHIDNRLGRLTGQQNYQGPTGTNFGSIAQSNRPQVVSPINNLAGGPVGQQNYQRPTGNNFGNVAQSNRPQVVSPINNLAGGQIGQQNYQGPTGNNFGNVAHSNRPLVVSPMNNWAGEQNYQGPFGTNFGNAAQPNSQQVAFPMNNLAGQEIGQQNYQTPGSTLLGILQQNRPPVVFPGRPVTNLINFIRSNLGRG